jgi:uncharacterized protein DUF2779
MAWLTKSRFLSGLQCHKRLWFEVHQPLETAPEPETRLLLGREFDEVVQRQQSGVVISREAGIPAAIEETKRALASGAVRLYQPAFRAGELAVIADVLERDGEAFELLEIKSSASVKKAHIPDAAYQALVIEAAGIPLRKISIGHVNNQFVLKRSNDYRGILIRADVTGDVRDVMPEIEATAVEFQGIVASDVTPSIDVGDHCTSPFECPFISRCHFGEPIAVEYSIATLPRGGKTLAGLIADGYSDLREVPAERLSSEMHRRVHEATVSGKPYFDEEATRPLRDLRPPFSYLDFETIGFAVPQLIGTRPYEQTPFQWSVHTEDTGAVRHAEYLAIESFGDFEGLVDELLAALPPTGPIFAYNAGFEERVLLRLAEQVPSTGRQLKKVARRLIDLLPVTRTAYYHRDMRGSWSIKSVMPTIDEQLGYEHLEGVQHGEDAQIAFLELRAGASNEDRKAALRSAMLRYCCHDTWTMVVLRRFLCGESIEQ